MTNDQISKTEKASSWFEVAFPACGRYKSNGLIPISWAAGRVCFPLVIYAGLLGALILNARHKLAALEQSRGWEEQAPKMISKEEAVVVAA